MPEDSQHSSAWNRHHGVGVTLLDNWVEERAVGERIIQERSNIIELSRQGHADLLTHSGSTSKNQFSTTNVDAYRALHPFKQSMGKRRQMLQAELLKIASKEISMEPVDCKENWKTTTLEDYAHSDIYPSTKKLGEKKPNQDSLKKFEKPITFWTDFAVKGSGTAICSTPAQLLHDAVHGSLPGIYGHKAGQVHQFDASAAPIRFGINSSFSTPIQEYQKGECKE